MTPVDLLKLNVNEHVEKKGQLSYLSWAWAWAEALKADPAAAFEVQMFGPPESRSPLCRIGETALVFVTVTLFGKPATCHLPVMDNRNAAIKNPDAFAVNKAIMRCLTKALALHGLGLYVFAGEDLPEADEAPGPDIAGILRSIENAPNLELLRAHYTSAMQMLPQQYHEMLIRSKDARKAELESTTKETA